VINKKNVVKMFALRSESVVSSVEGVVRGVVHDLCVKYDLNESEALSLIGLSDRLDDMPVLKQVVRPLNSSEVVLSPCEPVVKQVDPSLKPCEAEVLKKNVSKKSSAIILPYNGEMKEDCCFGLKDNWGLYTQCKNPKKNGKFCKVCQNQADKNNGIPTYGTIEDRIKVDIMDYKDPRGKSPIAYSKIMEKFDYTREQVEKEASSQNIKIDERHFMQTDSGKRGRPKNVSESVPKEETTKPKGVKGRPRKEQKVVEVISSSSGDLFEELIKQSEGKDEAKIEAKIETEIEAKIETEIETEIEATDEHVDEDVDEDEDEEEETDVVNRITYEGKKYLKSKNTGVIYNEEQDVVGKWIESTSTIEFFNEEEEEEEEE
jgi:hypothetical protein